MDDMKGMSSSNNTSSGPAQDTTCDSVKKLANPFIIVFYSLLFLVGLILNSFTLWFHCRRARRQVTKSWMIYLEHLTAADFLLCLSLPLRIIHYTSSFSSIYLLYCSFGASLQLLNMYASILFMGYIAANRYVKILNSSKINFLMTAKASHIISMATWFVLLTTATTYTISVLIKPTPRTSVNSICDDLLNEVVKPLFGVIHGFAAIIFLSVLFSMVFFYISASRRVYQIQQRQLGSSNSKKLVKSRRNMLVLVSVFCICFVPYHIVRVPYVILGVQCSVVLHFFKELTILISVFNMCLDPLIYIFLCKEFRTQFNLKQIFYTKGNRDISSSETKEREEQLKTINISGDSGPVRAEHSLQEL